MEGKGNMERLTSIDIIEHADGTNHEQVYCFGHLWGPAFFKKGTKDYEEYLAIVKCLAGYEDFEEIFRSKMTDAACELLSDKEEFTRWLDRNKWIAKKCDEYARTEEQGKLLKLPCAVGDTVYRISKGAKQLIIPLKVMNFKIFNNNLVESFKMECVDEWGGGYAYHKTDIGRDVFFTHQEAEVKLAEMEGKK